jgi:hypothetical protein
MFLCSLHPNPPPSKKEKKMKKLAIHLFVIGTIIATYALPVLAAGNAGP